MKVSNTQYSIYTTNTHNMTFFLMNSKTDIYHTIFILHDSTYCSTQSLHLLEVVAMVGMTFTVADRAVWPTLPLASKSRTDTR